MMRSAGAFGGPPTSPVVTAAIPRYWDAGEPSSPAMPSTEPGTSTTTFPVHSRPHAPDTAGTALSARPAYVCRASLECPVPRTRLCLPRTTVTPPWSHSCWAAFLAGLSASTYHCPSVSRERVRVRPTVTGALSYPSMR